MWSRRDHHRHASAGRHSQASTRQALPPTLAPRLICRDAAAAYVGVSPNTFDKMIADGLMPNPRRLTERRLAWDMRQLDAAIDRLPIDGDADTDTDTTDDHSWDDIDAQAKNKPVHIERWRDRHGKMRVYFRRDRRKGSPRIKLTGVFGSDEFHAAYARPCMVQDCDDSRPEDRATGQRHAGGTDRILQAGRRLPAICGKPRRRATCRGSTRSSASMARVRWRALTKSGSKPCWPPMTTGPRRSWTR